MDPRDEMDGYIHFNPLPPCGGRLDTVSKIADHIQFQSTPSVWRETPLTRIGFRVCVFQSTPSVWRETDG